MSNLSFLTKEQLEVLEKWNELTQRSAEIKARHEAEMQAISDEIQAFVLEQKFSSMDDYYAMVRLAQSL